MLQLGCDDAAPAIAVAQQGAHVIAVVDEQSRIERARRAVDNAEARVELHHGDLADLAFIRADTVDAAFSDGALARIEDVDRVFRQVHRVLKTDAPLLVVVPHPFFGEGDYFSRRTLGDLFASLGRAHFAVDTLLEPDDRTLVLRGRKLGN